jgi:hypothetical protein
MQQRTDFSSSLIIGAGETPSPRLGEGWGEGVRRRRISARVGSAASASIIVAEGKGPANLLEHAVQIAHHIAVPESYDGIAVRLDNARPLRIGFLTFGMLPAIDFDDEPAASTDEIPDGRPDRRLKDEFASFELAASQARPEQSFRVCSVPTQFSSDASQALSGHGRTPSPNRMGGRSVSRTDPRTAHPPAGERAYTSFPA